MTSQRQAGFAKLESPALLVPAPDQGMRKAALADEVSDATFFALQKSAVNSLLKQRPELLKMELPVEGGGKLNLELFQANIFSPDFQVYAASDRSRPFPFEAGVYYWGIVNDDEESLAAISIQKGEVMGFINLGGEVYSLGKLNQDADDTHVLFKESDLNISSPFNCGTDDDLHDMGAGQPTVATEKDANNCVKMYIEVDYDIFNGKGGVQQAASYVSGAFSQVAILYANEAINFAVNEIVVWDVADPYTGPSTSDYLNQFRNNLNGNYNGDLAHLVGYQGSGGIAYLDVLCNSYYGVGYSDINSTYANVPTYSWTIEVLTHEIGHNLGSKHTHACAWNGNNTAIDGCGPTAGYSEGCTAPLPVKGTIMSYCHLVGGVGIDFNLGFGPQPGDKIRSEVYNAPCLTSCTPPSQEDAGIASIISPNGTVCVNTLSPVVQLTNFGNSALNSVTIQYSVDGGTPASYAWTGNLASNTSTNVTLPSITFGNGAHTFSANTSNPNGLADGNSANDGSDATFNRAPDLTWYADADGDGYGNPNSSVVNCVQPSGYVSNNTDCNDSNANAYPGAPCNDTDVCTTGDVLDANCNCAGTFTDSDDDNVCDALDVCPGGDDNLDSNGNGIPDFCDCNPATESFPNNPLVLSGNGASSTTVNFAAGSKNPSFTISDLDSKLNGNPNSRYIESVTVNYVDGNGTPQTYGTFSGSNQATVNVNITSDVQSVTVSLTNSYGGNYGGTLSVDFTNINYCGPGTGCPDADGDGICDVDDVCPELNDNLIGTPCDDGDVCTVNDVYGTDCGCAGTYDSDGDGVCDGFDICPGGDDNVDTDGDGIPDFCDASNCTNEISSNFNPNPLTHSGSGSAQSNVSFPAGNTNVVFTISNLDAKLNGNPSKRYIEQVTVTYVDGNNATQTYGVFSGANQSTVDVNIAGVVQSVEISLTDIYDGDTGNEVMSVSMSEVSSCLETGGLVQGNAPNQFDLLQSEAVLVYPNPARGEVFLQFDEVPESGEVILSNTLGVEIGRYPVSGLRTLRIDLQENKLRDQLLLLNIKLDNRRPLTRRLVVVD